MANRFIIEIRTKGFTDAHKDLNKLNTQSRSFVKNANRAGGATAKLRSSFSALRNNLLLITFAFGGLFIAINKTVAAYRKQVEAETRLRASLRNVITASEDGADKLINLAAALQKVTTFGDENIIAGMAMLSTFQLNEDAIAALTPRMLDMAAAMGKGGDGLTTIALQLGKAFTGQVGALSRSGVLIDNFGVQMARAKGPTEEFAFLIEELDKNFKGLAEQLATTTLGQIDQMENRISDMNERMGQPLVPLKLFMKETEMFIMESLARWPLFFEKWKEFADLPLAERWKKSWAETEADFIKLQEAATFAAGKTNKTLEARSKELKNEQALETQKKINELLRDDGVISIQDKIALNSQKKLDLDALYNEGLIDKISLDTKSLEIENKGLQLANELKRENIKIEEERLRLLKETNEERLRIEAERFQLEQQLFANNLNFQLDQIDLQVEKFREAKFEEVAITQFAEEAKRDAIIANLEEQSVLYNAFEASYDQFVSTLVDSEMRKEEKFKRIQEAAKNAFVTFLAEQLKAYITNLIVQEVIAKTSQATAVASAAVTGKAIALAYVPSAALANASSFGGAAVAGTAAMIASIEAHKALAIKPAQEGADFITSGPQLMMVGEGRGPEHVQVTPLVDRNINGPQGGGITINIMGGVVHDDYIRNELIPALNKAVSLGAEINA